MTNNNPILIAVDQGYGQFKTPHCVFPTGIEVCMGDVSFVDDVLEWVGVKYAIGVGHKAFSVDKTKDEDFRLLTMAAIAKELKRMGLHQAEVYLAIGLPLDWAGGQMQRFREYMLHPSNLSYRMNGEEYDISIRDVMVYPQGFAAVADRLKSFTGMNMLCDIGNGTLSMMFINSGKPVPGKVYTVPKGVHECVRRMKDAAMKELHAELDDLIIEEFFHNPDVDVTPKAKGLMLRVAGAYVHDLMGEITGHGFDPQMMKLHILGGGMWLVKRFGDQDVKTAINDRRILLIEDIHATAKGYDRMARAQLEAKGVHVQ